MTYINSCLVNDVHDIVIGVDYIFCVPLTLRKRYYLINYMLYYNDIIALAISIFTGIKCMILEN